MTDKVKLTVVHCPEMADMAKQIIASPNIEGSTVDVSWGAFEDGFPNIFISDADKLPASNVIFLASFLNIPTILSQLSVIYAIPRYYCKSFMVVLPYFPTGTMERVDKEGQVATAKTLTRILSIIPQTKNGPTAILCYDIHALQERFYFDDSVIPLLSTAIPIFREALINNHKDEEITIAFPDEGAAKRFGKQFNSYPLITCIKVRGDGDARVVKIKEGDAKGKHVFIVDDLVKTGGTLIQCKNALLEAGAAKVSAYVTHPVFPEESWKRFIAKKDEKGFDSFYITDSCPAMAAQLKDQAPFKVLPIGSSIADFVANMWK